MKLLLPYRIISFILLPIAAFFGMVALFALLLALTNPAVLLPLFIFAAVVIYVIASFIFLQKGIDQNKVCKHSLKDWIKVNAIVAAIFCGMALIQSIGVLGNPAIMKQVAEQAISQQAALAGNEAMVFKIMKGTMYFMFAFSVLLIVHIFITFRFLKTYAHLFADKRE